MQTILTQEELDALVAQCKMMQAIGECYMHSVVKLPVAGSITEQ